MNWSRATVRRGVAIAVLALVPMVGACGDDGLTPLPPVLPTALEQNELARAERRWAESGMAGSRYTMYQQRICFCGDYMITWQVTVTNGVPTRVTSPTGLDLPSTMFVNFRSVEQLFAELREGITSGAVKEVAFDAARGYPAYVSLDPRAIIADDEVTYRTTGVTRIP